MASGSSARGAVSGVCRDAAAAARPWNGPRAASTSSSTPRTACPSPPARDPLPGGRPGPPRASRAVADRLRSGHREGRLDDRVAGVPAIAATSTSPSRRAGPSSPVGRRPGRRGDHPQRHRCAPCPCRPLARPAPGWSCSAGWCPTSGSSMPSRSWPGCCRVTPAPACTSSGAGGGRTRSARPPEQSGVTAQVDLLGHVDELTKNSEARRRLARPGSERQGGWGLSVVEEAASHGTPTVAYPGPVDCPSRSSTPHRSTRGRPGRHGGPLSIGSAGHRGRERLGAAAREHATAFTWERTVSAWEALLGRDPSRPHRRHDGRRGLSEAQ